MGTLAHYFGLQRYKKYLIYTAHTLPYFIIRKAF